MTSSLRMTTSSSMRKTMLWLLWLKKKNRNRIPSQEKILSPWPILTKQHPTTKAIPKRVTPIGIRSLTGTGVRARTAAGSLCRNLRHAVKALLGPAKRFLQKKSQQRKRLQEARQLRSMLLNRHAHDPARADRRPNRTDPPTTLDLAWTKKKSRNSLTTAPTKPTWTNRLLTMSTTLAQSKMKL